MAKITVYNLGVAIWYLTSRRTEALKNEQVAAINTLKNTLNQFGVPISRKILPSILGSTGMELEDFPQCSLFPLPPGVIDPKTPPTIPGPYASVSDNVTNQKLQQDIINAIAKLIPLVPPAAIPSGLQSPTKLISDTVNYFCSDIVSRTYTFNVEWYYDVN